MANPHGRSWKKIYQEEKRLNITPEKGATKKQRSRTITNKRARLKGGKISDARYRELHREKLRVAGRERVRTPAQLKRQAELTRIRRGKIKVALEKYPSKRTNREKELVASWEKEINNSQAKRRLTRQEKRFKELWRLSLTPERREKEAVKEAMAIWRRHRDDSRRPYVDDKGVKRMGSALSQDPKDQERMIKSIINNKRKWFNEGGTLLDWDHIIAKNAIDPSKVPVASGFTASHNMQFLDPGINRGVKSNWLTPKLLKSIEKAQMRFLKSKGLMNPMAWPSMLAGAGLIALSPEESKASMVGEGLIAAGYPVMTALSGPRLNRPREYTTEGGWRNQLGDPTFRQKKYTTWEH